MSDTVKVATSGYADLDARCTRCGSYLTYRLDADGTVRSVFCSKIGCPSWLAEFNASTTGWPEEPR